MFRGLLTQCVCVKIFAHCSLIVWAPSRDCLTKAPVLHSWSGSRAHLSHQPLGSELSSWSTLAGLGEEDGKDLRGKEGA